MRDTAEDRRLREQREEKQDWKRWGPYLSERQWGTVREDYSPDGTAWDYLPARSRPQPGLSLGRGRTGRALATRSSGSACRWPSGTAAIRSSRNGSSA